MRDTSEIRARIRQFVVHHFPQAGRRPFLDDEVLLGSGIIDSMGVLDLVGFLEGEFGIVITDEELLQQNFQTIERAATFVKAKLHGLAVPSGDSVGTND